jgi:hypothetical protein
MRRQLLLVLLAAILAVPLTFASAQGGEGAEIAASVDASAAEDGLADGDGRVSSIEQQIGTEVSRELNNYEGVFAGLKDIKDPRAQAVAGGVQWYEEYHKRLKERGLDDKAEQLDNGEDVEAVDPDNEELAENMETIDEFTREQEATGKLDPRAEAISWAVSQYGKPVSKQQVVETVRKGTNKYLDKAGSKYKKLTKRRINILLNRILTDDQSLLPLNGYWRAHPFEMTISGKCKDLNGDNGGGVRPGGEDEDPGDPLCAFRNPTGLPYFTWQSGAQVYEPGTPSIYSQGSRTSYEVQRDRGGASIGTITVTRTIRYQVISPTEIRVIVTISEQGGCTMTGEYKLELVTADNSICSPTHELPTPEPTAVPTQPSTVQTPEGPGESKGPFRAASPIFTDKTQCDETNSPPDISTLNIVPQTENTMLLDYGTGSQVVYRAGDNFYMYESGPQDGKRISISLTILDDGSASIFWSVRTLSSGKMCSMSQDFELPGSEPTATSTPDAQATPSAGGEATPVSGSAGEYVPVPVPVGAYKVTWTVMEQLCPANMQQYAPNFTEVTVSFKDVTTAVVTFAGGEYVLMDYSGQQLYSLINGEIGDVQFVASLSSTGPGQVFFTWSGMLKSDNNSTCTVMANLAQ